MATILTKKSDTASAVPSAGDLTNSTGGAELAVNTADKRLFTKTSGGTVVEVGTNPSSITTGTLSATGNVTLGDASGDSVTINAATVSTPNGLNFDSNTLVIDAANNRVGVNISSPVYPLDVFYGTGNQAVAHFSGNPAYAGRGLEIGTFSIGVADGGAYLDAPATTYGTLAFKTIGTERLRIDSSGNVGIGTSSPVQKLDVIGGTIYEQVLLGTNSTSNSAQRAGLNYRNYANTSNIALIHGADTAGTSSSVYVGGITKNPNVISFYTTGTYGVDGSERMRIDSSGNVGIGTSSPANTLQIIGPSSTGAGSTGNAMLIDGPSSTNGMKFFVDDTANACGVQTRSSDAFLINPAGGNVGIGTSSPAQKLAVQGNVLWTNGTITGLLGITGNSTVQVSANSNHPLEFRTNDTERMRIDSSGNLLVGTTNTSPATNNVAGGSFLVGASGTTIQASSNGASGFNRTASNGALIVLYRAGVDVGSIDVTTTATSYNTSSDYRLKENIAPMTGALATVAQLNPVTYNWKVDGSAGQGFIAHELAQVVPDCVTGEKDAVDADGNPVYQGIDTSFLVATLTAAIKEQQAIIESLKSRLDAAGL